MQIHFCGYLVHIFKGRVTLVGDYPVEYGILDALFYLPYFA